jgi:hypothetical protein
LLITNAAGGLGLRTLLGKIRCPPLGAGACQQSRELQGPDGVKSAAAQPNAHRYRTKHTVQSVLNFQILLKVR